MRLHTLTLQAFGPFPDRVCVDFDVLSDAGLFLLTGPTGAGKTFLLDAVTYALYGKVPGARGSTTRLRSDHAHAHTPPEVSVEFTADRRRLQITRSPEWDRPKKRGTGTTTEKSHVVLQELIDGSWKGLATRHPECNTAVLDALGLTAEQFTRVVLLPQGDFAAFLRADESERKSLLQSLFGTGDFGGVVAWLREYAAGLDREVQASRAKVEAAVDQTNSLFQDIQQRRTAAEVSVWNGEPYRDSVARRGADGQASPNVPDSTSAPGPPSAPVTPDVQVTAADDVVDEEVLATQGQSARPRDVDPVAVARKQLAVGAELADELSHTVAERTRQLSSARARWDAVRTTKRTVDDLAEAAGALRTLDATSDAVNASKEQARLAARAAPVRQQNTVVSSLAERLRTAQGHYQSAASTWSAYSLTDDWAPEPGASFDKWLERAREAAARLMPQVELDDQVSALRRSLEQSQAEVLSATARQNQAQGSVAAAEVTLHHSAEIIAANETEGARYEVLLRDLNDVKARAHDARLVDSAQLEVARLGTKAAEAQALIDRRRADFLQLRTQRLAGYAAELAADLNPGEPCVVCGSVDHPSKAMPTEGSVTAADEEAAAAAELEASQAHHHAATAHTDALAHLRDKQERAGGLTVADADTAVAAKSEEVRSAKTAKHRVEDARTQQEKAQRAHSTATREAQQAAVELAAATSAVAEKSEQLHDLVSRLHAARGPFASVGARLAAIRDAERVLRTVHDAEVAVGQLQERHDEADESLQALAIDAGFSSVDDALAAALEPPQLALLNERIRKYDEERAVAADKIATLVHTLREDTTAAEFVGEHIPDPVTAEHLTSWQQALSAALGRSGQTHAEQETRLTNARDALAGVNANLDSLRSAVDRLSEAHRGVGDKIAEHQRADDLARLASGTGGDNERGMGIESFVLAARLEQITAAANSRLGRMSSNRYSLVHSDAKTKGQRRAGLGIRVFDEWTSQHRDTASLSGGESFIASLALALGLADVVLAESGGRQLDTLFVDEGFGTLDAQTLDEVLGVMDALRRGGRAVGIISHVTEVKNRVATQVQVRKTTKGSTLQVSTEF